MIRSGWAPVLEPGVEVDVLLVAVVEEEVGGMIGR